MMATKLKPVDAAEQPVGLALLRAPFAHHHISKLPKETRAQIDARKENKSFMVWNCPVCGGHHHKDANHLDYVGHAALTDRLLDTDPEWNWEPMGLNPDGTPALDRNGGLWIKLTVCGVTRPGYGCADGKQGGDAMKEIIGDALRNAAMRFGAALDLWHKGDLHVDDEGSTAPASGNGSGRTGSGKDAPFPQGPAKGIMELKAMGRDLWRDVEACEDESTLDALIGSHGDLVRQLRAGLPDWWNGGKDKQGETYEGLGTVISKKQDEFRQANQTTVIHAG